MNDLTTVIVPLERQEQFERLLNSLNAKARKWGLDEIVVASTTPTVYVSETLREGTNIYVSTRVKTAGDEYRWPALPETVLNVIKLNAPVIKLGDYQVVGKLERLGEGIVTLSTTSSDENATAIRSYAEGGITCEHCKTVRNRKDSYVLRDASGGYIQVGTACLKDFTGHDPAAVLFIARLHQSFSMFSEDDFLLPSGSSPATIGLKAFLVTTAFCVKKYGWLSRRQAGDGDIPTTDLALAILTGNGADFADERKELAKQYEGLLELANGCIDSVKTKPADTEFDKNVATIFANAEKYLPVKYAGFAAAAMFSFMKAASQAAEKAARGGVSAHFGTVGDKITKTMKYLGRHAFSSFYGVSNIVKFCDPSGNIAIWVTSSSVAKLDGLEGQLVDVTGTIKAHSEFNGELQTEITRAKLNGWRTN